MAWYKVDDKLHSHPKARRAGLPAMGLWALAGSHCMDYLTDGVVESWFVESWQDGSELAARLVEVGLWDVHPDGWEFHDWGTYQPTAQQVIATREARSEAGRRGGLAKAEAFATANGLAKRKQNSAPSPVPSPSPETSKTSKSQSLDNRARSDDELSTTQQRMAGQHGLDVTRVRTKIFDQLGIRLSMADALTVGINIVTKSRTPPRTPTPYVLGSISRSPAEVEQYIHEAGFA